MHKHIPAVGKFSLVHRAVLPYEVSLSAHLHRMLEHHLRQLVYVRLRVPHNVYIAKSARCALLRKQRIYNERISSVAVEPVLTALVILARIQHLIPTEPAIVQNFLPADRFLIVPVNDLSLAAVVSPVVCSVFFDIHRFLRYTVFNPGIHFAQLLLVHKRYIEQVCALFKLLYPRLPEQI